MTKGLFKNLFLPLLSRGTQRQGWLSLLLLSSAPHAIAAQHGASDLFLYVLRTLVPLYKSLPFLWCEQHPHPANSTVQRTRAHNTTSLSGGKKANTEKKKAPKPNPQTTLNRMLDRMGRAAEHTPQALPAHPSSSSYHHPPVSKEQKPNKRTHQTNKQTNQPPTKNPAHSSSTGLWRWRGLTGTSDPAARRDHPYPSTQ